MAARETNACTAPDSPKPSTSAHRVAQNMKNASRRLRPMSPSAPSALTASASPGLTAHLPPHAGGASAPTPRPPPGHGRDVGASAGSLTHRHSSSIPPGGSWQRRADRRRPRGRAAAHSGKPRALSEPLTLRAAELGRPGVAARMEMPLTLRAEELDRPRRARCRPAAKPISCPAAMATFVGQRVRRREDPRFLRGQACYVDDLPLEGALHVTFVRSPWAHAKITGIDAAGVREIPGAQAFTAADTDLGVNPAPPFIGIDPRM